MPKFRVTYEQRITYSADVEATSAAEAITKACEQMEDGDYDFSETDSSEPENFIATEHGR